MSIYKRKGSPVFWYSFYVTGKNGENLRFRGPTGQTKKREAEKIERQALDKAKTSIAKVNAPETLNSLFERFTVEVAQYSSNAATIDYQLETLLNFFGKTQPTDGLNDNDLSRYVAKRRGQKNKRGKLPAPATINREIELLRRVFKHASENWDIEVSKLRWKKHLLAEPEERIRELTADEETRLFANMRDDLQSPVQFALATGLRLSNVFDLTWNQIDWDMMHIQVKMKSRKPGGKRHLLPITQWMEEIILDEKGNHPIHVFSYVCKKSRGLRKKGERYPFSKQGWKKDWYAALKAAEIEDFRFHDLRHTRATQVLRETQNLKLTQKALGHADIATTARYAHVLMDDVRLGMEKADHKRSQLRSQKRRQQIKVVENK